MHYIQLLERSVPYINTGSHANRTIKSFLPYFPVGSGATPLLFLLFILCSFLRFKTPPV